MLERTVASLETCKLQRILPQASAQAPKSGYRLRTGFWQHGALAIELSRSWPAILEERQCNQRERSRSGRSTARPIESDLQASAFQLDFLYPGFKIGNCRRGRTSGNKDTKAGSERRRGYGTSTDVPTEVSESSNVSSRQNAEHPAPPVDLDEVPNDGNDTLKGSGDQPTDSAPISEGHNGSSSPTQTIMPEEGAAGRSPTLKPANKRELEELLSLKDPQGIRHLDVYDAFARLDPSERVSYRPGVMVALSKSGNIVARNRCEALIRQITEDQWNNEVLSAIVGVFLRKKQRSIAVNYFKRGANKLGLSGGIGPLLVDMFKDRFWSGALKIWQIWYDARSGNGDRESLTGVLGAISVLDRSLPGLYFSFEQYLASGRAHELDAATLKSTNPAVTTFRHFFAEMALDKSSPKRAEVLLAFYQSRRLYHRYLGQMTKRWLRREIDRETAGGLHKIYANYRQQNDFKPSETILQGMFEVYYPNRLNELNALHDDWRRIHGELSQSGFNNYLKLHARLGNVAATRELIDRFYKAYPNADRNKAALRLMAVYARQGDVEAVQDVIKSISPENARHFERTIHRHLLQACSKSGQCEDAVECFQKMGELGLLDSPDYTQMMHMYSKMGDLDGTVRYFKLAQENSVALTPGMVLAVTLAFIGNDRLKDAETVVVEMADRGVTSTEIWNQLIKSNGIIGNLPRCYGILAVMKERKIEYLPSTYEVTLAAMVRYGQISAAVTLLEDAAKYHTFQPNDKHYAVVMAGAVRIGDYDTLAGLAKKMRTFSHQPSFSSQVALLAAAIKGNKEPQQAHSVALDIVKSLQAVGEQKREVVTSVRTDDILGTISAEKELSVSDTTPEIQFSNKLVDVSPVGIRQATVGIGHAVALLIELRDKFSVEELITQYLELQPQKPNEPLPETLMLSLMRAFYYDGQFLRVLEAWQKYWIQVSAQWIDPNTGLARPNKQYALVHLFELVTKCLHDLQDGEALDYFVKTTYATGFKMSSNNWNRAVQALAELDRVESAMGWCEIMLMPHWRGWQRFPDPNTHTPETNRFIRAINKAKLDPHFTRPHQKTILALYNKFMDLRRLSAWSPEKAVLLQSVEAGNPRLTSAFAKMPPGFMERGGKWYVSREPSFGERLDDFANKLTIEEAKEMMQSLEHLRESGAMEAPERLREALRQPMARTVPETSRTAQADIIQVLQEPLLDVDKRSSDSSSIFASPENLDAEALSMLEEKVQQKLEADRDQGDVILSNRMQKWRARTWKRGRYTRWDDQWAGWGDKTNAPP